LEEILPQYDAKCNTWIFRYFTGFFVKIEKHPCRVIIHFTPQGLFRKSTGF